MKNPSQIRIESLLKLRINYSTDAEFAEAAGIAPSFFGQIKRGERNIGEKLARKIEQELGLETLALDSSDRSFVREPETTYGKGVSKFEPKARRLGRYSNVEHIDQSDTVKIQHLSAVGGMGTMISLDVDHDSEITTIELTKQYLSSRLGNITNPVNLKIMSGIGDSMRGTFASGDTLFVDIGVTKFITEATYVIHFDDSIWIKNLARDGSGGYLIMSSNPGYPTVNAKKNDPKFRIIGMVVGVLNLNKLV